MKAYDAVIRVLDAAGVDTLFTLMAEDTLELLAELKQHWQSEMRLLEARHEQGAMAMADGYSRASDELGVCLVGRGPGIAQTGTALVTARKNGSKLLVIVPESPIGTRHDPKQFEQDDYLQATAGNVISARSHGTLIESLRDGIRQARRGTGPVVVQIPWDLLDDELPADSDGSIATPPSTRLAPSPTVPTTEQIEAAVDAYLDADATVPPIILAGRGAVAADAREALVALAEQTGGLLATTLRARGYFAEHPYGVGFVGEWGTDLANTVAMEAGCVFAVGCSLNPHTTDHGHVLRDDANVIHIDTDTANFERYTPVDVALHGDARLAAEQLTSELAALDINRADAFWTADRREQIAAQDPLADASFPEAPNRLDPRALVRALD